jgi:cholest-4-en-3-one 26-monooxygenase
MTSRGTAKEATIDFWDVSLFADGIPHALFKKLRRDEPIVWNPPSTAGTGFWSLTRYDDIVRVSRDSDTFSSQQRGVMMFDSFVEEAPDLARMMIDLDPPLHTRYRRLVNRGFTPRTVERLEPLMRTVVAATIDAVVDRPGCDFAADIAAPLPVAMIAELLGIPEADCPLIAELSDRIQGGGDNAPANDAIVELYEYAHRLAARKRQEMAEDSEDQDIVTVLLSATVDGDALTEAEFDLFFLLLAVAGNETTRGATTNGMLAFVEHPDQWARLRREPGLIDTAVDEILRWSSPLRYMARTATRDVTLHGRTIANGEKIVLWYASANFDEEQFPDPYRFDIGRFPNDHLAFGGGGHHFCLGASLARLELRTLFAGLAQRFRWFALDRGVTRMQNSFANGITAMPVTFTPATR